MPAATPPVTLTAINSEYERLQRELEILKRDISSYDEEVARDTALVNLKWDIQLAHNKLDELKQRFGPR